MEDSEKRGDMSIIGVFEEGELKKKTINKILIKETLN